MPEKPVRPEHTTGTSPNDGGVVDDARVTKDAGANGASGLAIIASKIEPPSVTRSMLTRPRLVGWLEQQDRARVMLISAEAGFGKSTLLSDYSSQTDATCIWYRLETSDGDWITYVSHLVAAVRREFPGFGQPTETLLRHVAAMGPTREVVVATFLADLATLGSAATVLILDDFHLVEGSEDVQMIMARLLERAPAAMQFAIASRGRPGLPLGRLAAQGRVAELTSSDLRFTREEIEQLFETAYGQPLGQETCDIVEERTEGWAASLQLVSASIAASRPSEVDHFIEALSGASGPIYEFLAEEVLSRLPVATQRVLVHAALADRVTAKLIVATLAATSEPLALKEVQTALRDVEALGLLSQGDDADAGARLHPLLRQFLEHQLAQQYSPDGIRAMHLAIASSARETDWLLAGKHFALSGHPEEAMLVLGGAASEALGTGAWGAAAEVVDTMPDTPPPPAVEVIKARALIESGRSEDALALLERAQECPLDSTTRALVDLTKAAALHTGGSTRLVPHFLEGVAEDTTTPFPLRDVAQAWRKMLLANAGGSIAGAAEALSALHDGLEHAGLHYYAGVTSHNYANAELARGRYSSAEKLVQSAEAQLSRTSDGGAILASTRLIGAAAMAESGGVDDALDVAIAVATGSSATGDSIAEAAYMCAITGRTNRASSLLARFERGDVRGSRELSSRAQAHCAGFALALATGDLDGGHSHLECLASIKAPDIDARSRLALAKAIFATVSGRGNAKALVVDAIAACGSQGAWRWMARARILEAVVRRDAKALGTWIEDSLSESVLAVHEMADVVASALDLLDGHQAMVERAVVQAPGRWVPALGRCITQASPAASAAAALVARFGAIEDATVLRDFDSARGGRSRRRGFVAALMRRVSPTVRLHDLGPANYEVGNRRVSIAETRRKAASLFLFLATRQGFAAAREQVMESLWPDQTPKSSLNSLHQTLFFLRRDIDPWYEEGSSADYVRLESDLVFLDPELFQVDSVAFARQCADILSSKAAAERGPELLRLYKGRFAPEFEYEEWAQEWRTQLHGAFLHLAHSTGEALIGELRHEEAAEILAIACSIDALAYDLKCMLIRALAAVGSTDAARAHYEGMAALYLRDMGVHAPTYRQVIDGDEKMT